MDATGTAAEGCQSQQWLGPSSATPILLRTHHIAPRTGPCIGAAVICWVCNRGRLCGPEHSIELLRHIQQAQTSKPQGRAQNTLAPFCLKCNSRDPHQTTRKSCRWLTSNSKASRPNGHLLPCVLRKSCYAWAANYKIRPELVGIDICECFPHSSGHVRSVL